MSFRMSRTRVFVILVAVIMAVVLAAGVWSWRSSRRAGDDTPSPAGPTVKSSAGPNAQLPPVKAGSKGCAAMDTVLSNLLEQSPQGKTFTQRVAQIQAQQTDPNAGTVNATPEWAQFLQILPKHYAEFAAAGGTDSDARKALDNLHKIVEIEPRLISGEIPEYTDPEAAQRLLDEGTAPAQNPKYVENRTQLDKALDQVTWCLPTWPVIFG